MSVVEITETVLKYPREQRLELAKALTESLDENLDQRLEELWRLELAERIRQAEGSDFEPVAAEEARRLAREKVNEARRLSSSREQ